VSIITFSKLILLLYIYIYIVPLLTKEKSKTLIKSVHIFEIIEVGMNDGFYLFFLIKIISFFGHFLFFLIGKT
jgi:hypothetical protein